MRNELEVIRQIEQYINGELSNEEAAAFEQQMASDASLREDVALQRDLMQGIGRLAIKQRVSRAGKSYHYTRNLIRFAVGGAIVVLITAAILFVNRNNAHVDKETSMHASYNDHLLPELNETGKREWATADSILTAQLFTIDVAKDTVIETKGGIVLSIPANAFTDGRGNAVTGSVTLCLKEALDPQTILKAGLSTMSGGRLLETGGMFFVDVRKGSAILKINPKNSIYAEIPNSGAKANMQLFAGKRLPGGAIDWANSTPLPNDLVTVDITNLDFYPKEYLPFLRSNRYAIGNRKFTDSVYYSLAALFADDETVINNDASKDFYDYGSDVSDSNNSSLGRGLKRDIGPRADTVSKREAACGINPAKVKTIKDDQYQKTLLATREFALRMKLIHTTHNPALLDLYVDNLNKSLFEIDAMAARLCSGKAKQEFLQFAALRNGKVKDGSKQFEMLRSYYALKAKLYTEAIAQAEAKIRAQQTQADNDAQLKQTKNAQEEQTRRARNLREELQLNLESAYRQLGYNRIPSNPSGPAATSYTVPVTNTGWCNVDRYVYEATTTRTTLNYTDATSGRKAVIDYSPLSASISDPQSFSRLLVYLVPDQLSSFIKLDVQNGMCSYKLNGLMHYSLVCIGYKDTAQFILKISSIEAKDYSGLRLQAVDKDSFERMLGELPSVVQTVEMRKDLESVVQDLANIRLQQQRRKWEEMMISLRKLLFPCLSASLSSGKTLFIETRK